MSNVLKSITKKGEVKYFCEQYTKYNIHTTSCTKMHSDNDWSSALLYYKYIVYRYLYKCIFVYTTHITMFHNIKLLCIYLLQNISNSNSPPKQNK